MKTSDELKDLARSTLVDEAKAVEKLASLIDEQFVQAANLILNSNGKTVITGIGKSAIIAQKISATLNSTGTPSVFMHAADAIHGDIGTIQSEDIVICISKSGNSPEIKVLVPILKSMGNKLIGIVGNMNSDLASKADIVLNTTVDREACPNNLAPTSSTLAQMAMGDALAVALLHSRNFTSADFARFHPGGSLGKQLYLKASDLYIKNTLPVAAPDETISQVIVTISEGRLGMAAIVENDQLVGIITDGDLRRMMESGKDARTIKAAEIMKKNPKTIAPDLLAVQALEIMKDHNITQLIVVENGKPCGVIHLHDLLKEGII